MRSTTKLLLTTLATITLALTLLQGTGAVELTQGDDVGQSIVLEPHPGPNGQYAYYDENDELAVDLSASNPNVAGDGPNDDAVTAVPDVFTVTNEGDSAARVWIESGHPLATFTARGDSIEGADRAVTLAPNESVAVGLHVVTTDDVLPDVVVDSFELNAVVADGGDDARDGDGGGDARPGDGGNDQGGTADGPDGTTTTVTSPAANERGVTVQQPDGRVSVGLDGMHVAGANVTLDRVTFAAEGSAVEFGAVGRQTPGAGLPGLAADHVRPDGYVHLDRERVPDSVSDATLHVSVDRDYLDWRGADPDDVVVYRLGADGWTELETRVVERGGRVHYAADAAELSSVVVATRLPAVEVVDATIGTRRLAPDESTTVTAELRNTGREDGNATIPVVADGERVATATVELDPDESTTVSPTVDFEAPGEYDLSVGGVDAGTVVVEPAATATEPGGQPPAGTAASGGEDRDPPARSTVEQPADPTTGAGPGLATVGVVAAASLLVAVVLGRRLVAP